MLKKIYFIVILLLLSLGQAVVQVSDLVGQGRFYDNKLVVIQGEVIGNPFVRGEKTWLNILTTDRNAIGVFCSKQLADKVKIFGNYKFHGDEVLITGIFQRFAPQHNGETMITAQNLQIIKYGYRTKHGLAAKKIYFSIICWLIILIVSLKGIIRKVKYFFLMRRKALQD